MPDLLHKNRGTQESPFPTVQLLLASAYPVRMDVTVPAFGHGTKGDLEDNKGPDILIQRVQVRKSNGLVCLEFKS